MTSFIINSAATPKRIMPKVNLTDFDFNFFTINLEPVWLPNKTAKTHNSQIIKLGCAAVAICETKLELPEKVTTIDDVAAAILASKPTI